MRDKDRIKQLEKMILDLQARIATLEARPIPQVWTFPPIGGGQTQPQPYIPFTVWNVCESVDA